MKSQRAQWALYLRGFKSAPIQGVTLVDCDFGGVEKASVLEYVDGMKIDNVRVNGSVVERME